MLLLKKNGSNLVVVSFQKQEPEGVRMTLLPPEYLGVRSKKNATLISSTESIQTALMSYVFRQRLNVG